MKETFGCDGQPDGVHDIEYCDTILHVGINTAETQTVLWMHELDRLRGPDPPRSIVIDPRETESAREARGPSRDQAGDEPRGSQRARAAS